MTGIDITVLRGVVLDQDLRLAELCRLCDVDDRFVRELVAYGVIEPCDPSAHDWRFRPTSVRRVRTARHLQRDLDVNLAGIALALDLLDELQALRARLS